MSLFARTTSYAAMRRTLHVLSDEAQGLLRLQLRAWEHASIAAEEISDARKDLHTLKEARTMNSSILGTPGNISDPIRLISALCDNGLIPSNSPLHRLGQTVRRIESLRNGALSFPSLLSSGDAGASSLSLMQAVSSALSEMDPQQRAQLIARAQSLASSGKPIIR